MLSNGAARAALDVLETKESLDSSSSGQATSVLVLLDVRSLTDSIPLPATIPESPFFSGRHLAPSEFSKRAFESKQGSTWHVWAKGLMHSGDLFVVMGSRTTAVASCTTMLTTAIAAIASLRATGCVGIRISQTSKSET